MRAIVIGGGIGGVTAALALRRAGIEADVYERAFAATEVGAGISVWGNAIRALESIDAAVPVLARGEPMSRGGMKTWRGRVQSAMDMAALDRAIGVTSIIIHRAELLEALSLQLPPERLHFGHELAACEDRGDHVIARFQNGATARGDVMIGADGLRSRVREAIFGKEEPRYSGYTCWRGIVRWPDFSIIEPGHISETWGRGARFGVIRMTQDRIYWFATWNAPPLAPGASTADSKRILGSVFGKFWKPIPELIEATAESHVMRNDILDRPPRQGWSKGRLTLLGDAAHPTTPNIGQGGCLAIEDAIVLARRLARERDPASALAKYENERFERCAEITNFSWKLGVIGQLANPLLCEVRDFLFRLTPKSQVVAQHSRYVGFDVTRDPT